MTDDPVALLREAADKATPGEWFEGDGWVFTDPLYADDNRLANVLGMKFADPDRAATEKERAQRNVKFIVAARNHVDAVLAEVVRLRAQVEAVKTLHVPYDCTAAGEPDHETCGEREWCYTCGETEPWPCSTIRALEGGSDD